MLPDYNVPLFASDDIDFTHLISPARAVHRRTRSDPTEIDFASLRADVAADRSKGPGNLTTEVPLGGSPVRMRPPAAASIKRDLSPMPGGTGFSPAIKRQSSHPVVPTGGDYRATSTSNSNSDDDDELPLPGELGLAPLPLGPPLDEKKQPNYNKKDVPMWTVEEDLLILQLVEQVCARLTMRALSARASHTTASLYFF